MTKGIREFAQSRFTKLLPKAADMGPTAFRRRVMDDIQRQFDVSVASAATAYNYVLQKQRSEDPDSVEGIGRGFQPTQARGGNDDDDRASKGKAKAPSDVRDPVTLVKVRGGEIVAENISRMFARQLVEAAKPKLMIKEEEDIDA
jgi:hypothetical protein